MKKYLPLFLVPLLLMSIAATKALIAVYYSTDNGVTWQLVTDPSGTLPPQVATVPPPVIVPPPPTTVPSTGKPSAANTGPHIALTAYTDTLTITTPQTITGKSILRQVNWKMPAGGTLLFSKCSFDGNNNFYCINESGGNAGKLIAQDCSFTNAQAAAIIGNNWTLIRCDIGGFPADGTKAGNNCNLQRCYIHDYGNDKTAHADAIQMVNGANVVVNGNTIDGNNSAHWNNSGGFYDGSNGPITGLQITNNWFEGGTNFPFCLQSNQSGAIVTGNVIEGTYQYGLLGNPRGLARPAIWSGNVDGSGKTIALPAQN